MEHICFFGFDSGKVLWQGKTVSGEGLQHVLLARAFRDLGYRVTVIGLEGDAAERVVDGIRVLRGCDWHSGLPVVRFVHPRATGPLRALRDADADVYYQSPAGVYTGITAAFCRRSRRKFIFRVASDANCVPGGQLIDFWRDRKIYEYGLRRADLVAVQSRRQRALLKTNYGLDSEVVDMVVDVPDAKPVERDIDVVWVNNLRPVKRAECLLKVAAQLPEFGFVMIGGKLPRSEPYYERIASEAAQLKNVHFLGPLPYDEVNDYIARAKVMLNTSTIEGFPNTFLQAWVREVPVVSFFDPDDTITRAGLGRRPLTEDELGPALRALLEDRPTRERIGRAAREYAVARFSPAASAKRYLELLH